MMGDQDLLKQITIGKSNLAKVLMSGDSVLIEKVGIFYCLSNNKLSVVLIEK